jgi:tRNA U34 5-methylaminomethyl-2-thiouridine-forming methyltransferase MnmC
VKITKQIITTADGSSSIYIPEWNEHYHSHHGAVQEAKHVFLKHGLAVKQTLNEINILEVGFGTGLNAFLSVLEVKSKIDYTGLEAYPLEREETKELNYAKTEDEKVLFSTIQSAEWDKKTAVSNSFQLSKLKISLQDYQAKDETFDIIYFDAFGPRVQPEMWTTTLFQKLYNSLKKEGIFVTYCAKGQVKRDLKAVGFEVETLPGPPGKREMTRGWKR